MTALGSMHERLFKLNLELSRYERLSNVPVTEAFTRAMPTKSVDTYIQSIVETMTFEAQEVWGEAVDTLFASLAEHNRRILASKKFSVHIGAHLWITAHSGIHDGKTETQHLYAAERFKVALYGIMDEGIIPGVFLQVLPLIEQIVSNGKHSLLPLSSSVLKMIHGGRHTHDFMQLVAEFLEDCLEISLDGDYDFLMTSVHANWAHIDYNSNWSYDFFKPTGPSWTKMIELMQRVDAFERALPVFSQINSLLEMETKGFPHRLIGSDVSSLQFRSNFFNLDSEIVWRYIEKAQAVLSDAAGSSMVHLLAVNRIVLTPFKIDSSMSLLERIEEIVDPRRSDSPHIDIGFVYDSIVRVRTNDLFLMEAHAVIADAAVAIELLDGTSIGRVEELEEGLPLLIQSLDDIDRGRGDKYALLSPLRTIVSGLLYQILE
jgi:hypothetical protein